MSEGWRGNPFRVLQTLRQQLAAARDDLRAVRAMVEDLRGEVVSAKLQPLIAAGQLASRTRTAAAIPALVPPDETAGASSFFERLEALQPEVYPVWRGLFDEGAAEYLRERSGSCSDRSNDYAEAFRGFLALSAEGRILDLGSGIFRRPSYLEGFAAERLAGVEPLDLAETPDFMVVQTTAEFLPWPDASFETVVAATSLDHVLDLDAALAEVRRVLAPGGCFVLWIASVPGSAAWDPACTEPMDRFHLFQFDSEWFEPRMEREFVLADRVVFPTPSFDHVFYRYERRDDSG